MIRVGIIGTDSSHAMEYGKIINRSFCAGTADGGSCMRVVGVYDPDFSAAENVSYACGADFTARSLEDFWGRVDAAVITSRKGSLHMAYAEPFLERKLPLFIDKPITADPLQAKALLGKAKAAGVPVTGGSGCKWLADTEELAARADALLKEEELYTAVLSHSADPGSVYDGLYFYASHLIELALCVFGYDVKRVRAVQNGRNITALFRYQNYDITLLFARECVSIPCCLFSTTTGYEYRMIDFSHMYERQMVSFAHMLRTGEMPFSYEELVSPVCLTDAIRTSLEKDGTEENVCGCWEVTGCAD